ncbi:MAG: fibronectin type III domain-containing protein [Bdellovibrionaceae bacterium]|nr:fibronectin type III domain-containing protein [Bdellovibrionales bacterium]MCB9085716.1 fibronectin type III domain-containing protein [Pseudobdellovibrionaceae bacterium]
MRLGFGFYICRLMTVVLLLPLLALSCGEALPLHRGNSLGSAVGGESPGAIYSVKMVIPVTGSASIPTWNFPGTTPVDNAANDYPFSRPLIDINEAPFQDTQTPFYFSFSYPPNNFKIANAHLVIDTARDGSDTEGIFVDSVLTGRPPATFINDFSPRVLHAHWVGNPGGNPVNSYYMDYSLTHYKQNTINTFDLDLEQLLTPSPLSILDILQDGFLPVVTGDDSPIYQAYLVINGYTISKSSLSCATSPTATFENHYLHNDGNSIGQAFFSGTVEDPFTSWSSGLADTVEYYFDTQLPLVNTNNIAVTTATMTLNVQRTAGASAIAINGVAVGEAGFNTSNATSAVERWETGTSYVNYWNSILAPIPTDSTPTAVTIDLVQLLGASVVRDLLAQGKFNVAVAGGLKRVEASNATVNRTFGSPVSGPELNLQGTYFTETCVVPNDPDSPLQDGPVAPPDPGDTDPPEIISAQATEITSTTAVVHWLTNEGADTQIGYGIGSISQTSTYDATPRIYHRVELTGLQPYKFYFYEIYTADQNGNPTTSNMLVFRTLR